MTESRSKVLTNEYIKDISQSETLNVDQQIRQPSFVRDVCPYFLPTILLAWYFFTLVFLNHALIGGYVILMMTPLFNKFVNNDSSNIHPKNEKAFASSQIFMIPMYVYTFAELSFHFYSICLFSDKWQPRIPKIFEYKPNETWLAFLSFIAMKSFFHACSLTTGHELHHQPHWISGFIGNLSYVEVIMPWYWDEHTAHHHKWAATDLDPASAKFGSNSLWTIYKAYFRIVANVWSREEMRIEKTHRRQSWFLTLAYNKMTRCAILISVVFTAIYMVFGWGGLKIQLWSWFLGILWMEGANFVEHYGLRREKDDQGIYESMQYQHSWNATASPVLSRI